MKRAKWLLSLLVVLLIASCGPSEIEVMQTEVELTLRAHMAGTETQSAMDEPTQAPTVEPTTEEPTQTDTPEPTETPTITPTPTPDTRPLPEDWRSWPVVPDLPAHLIEVYWSGIERGNDPTHFSKVGDCGLIPAAFFGIYDRPGQYYLGDRYAYLQETIDNFAGSFGREGYSLKGGMNFPAIFSPLRADPTACLPGETPIECELRIWKPSFIFINIENRYSGRTVEGYEEYLRRAVALALENGTVPFLATKADNVEGDHRYNLAVARVAYDLDLPLWNFWLAVQSLPDHGIDWATDAHGFHLTVAAWNTRSSRGLRTLDRAWRTVNGVPLP
jgi:hypothetical protein